MTATSRRASVLALLLLLLLPVSHAGAQDLSPTYSALPMGRTMGEGMSADAAGAVWFGVNMAGAETEPPLMRFTPADGAMTTVPTGRVEGADCCANFVRDVAVDRQAGRVWFTRSTGAYGFAKTDGGPPQIARVDPAVDLGDVAVAPGGTAWFAENGYTNANQVFLGNRIDAASASLSLTKAPVISEQAGHDGSRYAAEPEGVTIAPDGSTWFTEADSGLPGWRIAKVTGGGYTEYRITPEPTGSTTEGPTSIAATPDGRLWFTLPKGNRFGVLDPSKPEFTLYSLADLGLAGGTPRVIRTAPDGTLWLAESGYISNPTANAIVRIVPGPTPTATVYKTGTGRSPQALAIGTEGSVWFGVIGDGSGGEVGRLAGAFSGSTDPGSPTTGGGAPTSTTPATTAPKPGAVVLKPASTAKATITDPKVRGADLSANQICVGPPEDKCSLVYLLQSHEYVKGFPGTTAAVAAKKRKTRLVIVGTKKVTLSGGQTKKVTVSLNKRGRKILKRDGKVNATFVVKQRNAAGKLVKVKAKKVRFKKR